MEAFSEDIINLRQERRKLPLSRLVYLLTILGIAQLARTPVPQIVRVAAHVRVLGCLRPLNISTSEGNEVLLVEAFEAVYQSSALRTDELIVFPCDRVDGGRPLAIMRKYMIVRLGATINPALTLLE